MDANQQGTLNPQAMGLGHPARETIPHTGRTMFRSRWWNLASAAALSPRASR